MFVAVLSFPRAIHIAREGRVKIDEARGSIQVSLLSNKRTVPLIIERGRPEV